MQVTLAMLLVSIVGNIVARVLVTLGFQIVTISGVLIAWNQLKALLMQNLAGLPLEVLQLATLAGVPVALGMIIGAYTAAIGYWQVVSATRILGVKT